MNVPRPVRGDEPRWPRNLARRQMLERSLEEDPSDAFLHYGLAMQCFKMATSPKAVRD